MVAAFGRETIDYPVMRFLNLPSQKWPGFDNILVFLASTNVASGVVLLSLIWHAWFRSAHSDYRASILMGTAGASASGLFSRLLQLTLPTHLRPLHDPGLSFLPPSGVGAGVLNHWNSFPSDHAAVYFGMATVIYLAQPKLGYGAIAWATVLNLIRNYLGFHFLSDVAGGGAIGALTVLFFQGRSFRKLGLRMVAFERHAAPAFYMAAFFLSYQIATFFDEVRHFTLVTASVISALWHHLFP
jgi:undecaprenyl-diphosphatase